MLHFPFEIRVGIEQDIERYSHVLSHWSDARWREHVLRHVTVHGTLITRQTVANAPLQVIEPTHIAQKRLVTDIP